jgi:hypothetical protein
VAQGAIDRERYESYGKLFAEGGRVTWEMADL